MVENNTKSIKSNIFEIELSYIQNPRLKESAIYLLENLPDYFFIIAATCSGKYHPKYAQGERGLVRHTKAAIAFLYTYLEHPFNIERFTSDERDLMIISLLIHDGFKRGVEQGPNTLFEHPVLSAKYVKETQLENKLTDEEVKIINGNILSHMGPWNKDKSAESEDLPIPVNKMQILVHFADYYASRKTFEVSFDNQNNVIKEKRL